MLNRLRNHQLKISEAGLLGHDGQSLRAETAVAREPFPKRCSMAGSRRTYGPFQKTTVALGSPWLLGKLGGWGRGALQFSASFTEIAAGFVAFLGKVLPFGQIWLANFLAGILR
ncbi:hypothetical protein CFBP5877_12380 [Agrobacterium tumefaciens]|uniref:Uncharacterized protein n=1 Tax=Agrobacterium tumefaciens TaxID=358 RepID=A0AAE6EFD7_AGRTU|nr:hypothetical protein CFBP5499_12850 [Agrobacterium tumefaciens]QCL79788.1 hypothetical protein CFBP5877_12380 [Agrobacterium tumefaciens]